MDDGQAEGEVDGAAIGLGGIEEAEEDFPLLQAAGADSVGVAGDEVGALAAVRLGFGFAFDVFKPNRGRVVGFGFIAGLEGFVALGEAALELAVEAGHRHAVLPAIPRDSGELPADDDAEAVQADAFLDAGFVDGGEGEELVTDGGEQKEVLASEQDVVAGVVEVFADVALGVSDDGLTGEVLVGKGGDVPGEVLRNPGGFAASGFTRSSRSVQEILPGEMKRLTQTEWYTCRGAIFPKPGKFPAIPEQRVG